jgi:chromosome segregation ATPase
MSVELRQLREQRDALNALAEALRTQDGWLSYRAEALDDQLLEHEGQAATRPPAIGRIHTALIDRDEALQQARGDLEKVRTVASDWEAEVGTVRSDNRELCTWLQEAQSQQSRAEERAREAEQKAKEADELKATLAAKVAAVATAEKQLRKSAPPARRPRASSSRSGPPLPTLGRRFSRSAPPLRGRRSRWRSGMPRSRGSMGS